MTLVAGLPGAPAHAAAATHADGVSAAAYGSCPAGWFCAWDGPGETGRFLMTQVSIPDLSAVGMDNRISSVWNRTAVAWCAYDDPHEVGPLLRVGSNWRGSLPGGSDNMISSLRRGC
ncbi:peptidase inhibitor family I36 protein [Amycolatopsis sp. TRM77291]